MPHFTFSGRPRDQLLTELYELLAVDGGFFVGQDEEADLMVTNQGFNLVDDLLGIANAIVAPEFPLAAEAAGERAAARQVGDRHPHAERHIDVFFPFQDRPVRADRIQVFHRWRSARRQDGLAVAIGQALDLASILRVSPFGDRRAQVYDDLFAFAAHDHVNPGRFGEHLFVHEGVMHAAKNRDRLRGDLAGDLERLFGLLDRRCNGRGADHVRLKLGQSGAQSVIVEMMGHRVDEGDIG